jgi:hypothetical protein
MFVRGVDRIVEEAKLIAGEIVAPVDGDVEGAGEFAVREWISYLAKYSMAQLQPEDSFSVHGLVHGGVTCLARPVGAETAMESAAPGGRTQRSGEIASFTPR